MISLTFALSVALSATTPHRISVEHRDATYDVTYQPEVRTRTKTIGIALPNRSSAQRCRWFTDLRVVRTVRRAGQTEGHETALSDVRSIDGSVDGDCKQARGRVAKDQESREDTVRQHLAAAAAADREALLADIDAAYALASAD